MALARWRQLNVRSLESAAVSSTVEELNVNNPGIAEVAAQRTTQDLCFCAMTPASTASTILPSLGS
jgi:hypothetical protein